MTIQAVRSFIALYPDAEALSHIVRYMEEMAARSRLLRWEKPDQVHITLKFLGDLLPRRLDAIAIALNAQLRGSGEVQGLLNTVGAFPRVRDARILWLGYSDPPERILDVQKIVEASSVREGAVSEIRRFTPHFTIGRVKMRGGKCNLENDIDACSFQPVHVRSTAIRIMESTLTPEGAIHRERASIVLTPGE
jgi:RNA 2',3'-cyclic 3'-phosphodiesterase